MPRAAPGQEEEVADEGGVDGPDRGSGDDDLAQRVDGVAELEGSQQPVAAGAGQQVGGHGVEEIGDRGEVAVQGGSGHAGGAAMPASASGSGATRIWRAAASMICWRVRAVVSARAPIA